MGRCRRRKAICHLRKDLHVLRNDSEVVRDEASKYYRHQCRKLIILMSNHIPFLQFPVVDSNCRDKASVAQNCSHSVRSIPAGHSFVCSPTQHSRSPSNVEHYRISSSISKHNLLTDVQARNGFFAYFAVHRVWHPQIKYC